MRAWQRLAHRCLVRQFSSRPRLWQDAARRGANQPNESLLSPAVLNRARSIVDEHASLKSQIESSGYDAALAKKAGELSNIVAAMKDYTDAQGSVEELRGLIEDPEADEELRNIALEEREGAEEVAARAAATLKTSLVPVHPFAKFACLIELRPGAGGSEAAIFAADLLKMYQAFCKRHRLRTDVLKIDESESRAGAESLSEVVLEVDTEGAYGLLRCEAGVHRVQRVPATETKGRTHTSAVSVLVLPSIPDNAADELGAATFDDPNSDYYIDPKDVRTDVMRASGAGGQHVNKTESKVRLVHEPTGTTVEMQESRSQQKNREKAWQLLRSKIAQARREAREDELASLRLSVVGVAKMGRGDKVRTYNWGQQRVTDHRSGMTVHNLDDCMAGGLELDDVMQSVRVWQSEQELAAVIAEEEAVAQEKDKADTKTKK